MCKEPHPQLAIRPASQTDVPTICRLAEIIWEATYPGIISQQQIDYMLARMYAPATVETQMRKGTADYFLAEYEQEPVGFLCLKRGERPATRFLDKCYLLPKLHGWGMGQELLAFAEREAHSHHCLWLELRCNKRNTKAIAAYQRYGMQISAEVCTDIGGGFLMDDYLLHKSVAGPRTRQVTSGHAG